MKINKEISFYVTLHQKVAGGGVGFWPLPLSLEWNDTDLDHLPHDTLQTIVNQQTRDKVKNRIPQLSEGLQNCSIFAWGTQD